LARASAALFESTGKVLRWQSAGGNLRPRLFGRAIDWFEGDIVDAPALTALVQEAIAYNQRKRQEPAARTKT